MTALGLRYIGAQDPQHPATWPVGSVFPLCGHITLIGRSQQSHIILPSPHLARRHARLTLTTESTGARACWLEDLGGTNGTFIQGAQGLTLLSWEAPPFLLRRGERIFLAGLYELELTLIL